MKTKYYLTALAAVLFSACSNESNEVIPVEPETEAEAPVTPVALQVQANISATTRVANGAFAIDDAIGVYAVSTATDGLTSGVNVKYVATNTTADFSADAPIYFQDRNDVNVSAYYPYAETVTNNILSVSLSDQKDILFAHKDNVAYTETSLALTFDHVLTQLTLVLKAGDGIENLNAITAVKLKDLVSTASWNVLTGALTNGDTKTDYEVTSFTANQDGSKSLSLLAFPVSGETSIALKVTYDGVDYDATLTAGSGLAAGNNYTYTVNIKQSGLAINGSTINEWADATFTNTNDANADAKLESDTSND
jgi:hypothetical protein